MYLVRRNQALLSGRKLVLGCGTWGQRCTQFRASVFEETPKHVLKNGKMNPFRGAYTQIGPFLNINGTNKGSYRSGNI